MVSILVDEAYAFDYLAILLIKYDFSKNESILTKTEECTEHIQSQIGKKKMDEILSSEEFKKVIDANKKTFDWVDKAKTDSCKASDVDRSNYIRCQARNALQEKFFPTKKISEVKFGYQVYNK